MGVVFDRAGSLYGGTAYGGNYTSSCKFLGEQTGCGVGYKMSHHGSGWTFNTLSSFDGANGYNPEQLITVAPDGSLYGTARWAARAIASTMARVAEPSSTCNLRHRFAAPCPVPGLSAMFTCFSEEQVTARLLMSAA